tara:strand:+ start:50 stop:466 length:417 start_codon:yes stop_codon:yes gene_type:complete
MSLTTAEATQIKIDVEVLKNTTSQVLKALCDNTDSIKVLISKMDAHDVRREYEDKEKEEAKKDVAELAQKVELVNERMDSYITNVAPVIARAKAKQETTDNFIKSMSTTWGKMTAGIIVTASLLLIAYVFGVNIPKFL